MALMEKTSGTPVPENLTVPEVAEILRLSASHVYAMVRRGELPHFKVGASPRIRRKDLDAYIQARLVAVIEQ
jgi:excisionase family DNA binding protein